MESLSFLVTYYLFTEEKGQCFGKALRPSSLVMRSAIIDNEPQTCLVQSRTAQDRRQFSHVVDHALISILPSRFCCAGRQEDPFRPAFHSAALPDQLSVRGPK